MTVILPKRIVLAAALILPLLGASAQANTTFTALPYNQCFEDAATKYGVDADLLRSMAWHESRLNPTAHNTGNFNQSEDIGVMQINSWWLSNGLEKRGITRHDLWDPCTNIDVGAWILSQAINDHGDIWTGVGYYNAVTEWKRERYITKIRQSLADLRSGRVHAQYWKGRTQAKKGGTRSETLTSIPKQSLVAARSAMKAKASSRTKRKPPPIIIVAAG